MSNGRDTATGTTAPIFIAGDGEQRIEPGRDYFYIQIVDAQAVFSGSVLKKTNRLVVTSQVGIDHPALGGLDLISLQRTREVHRDRVEKLGLSPNLVSLVPATMTHVSISIDYLLDSRNRLIALAGLINDNALLAAVSFSVGATVVAKTVGTLAQKLLGSFMSEEERRPILQFTGDFNIVEDGLREGYYAILASRDPDRPLPTALAALTVHDGTLHAGAEPVSVSYVVLKVGRAEARGRERNDGAVWDQKLHQAEDLALEVARDRSSDQDTRATKWQTCKKLLIEARALLLADLNYTSDEVDSIYWATWALCEDALLGSANRGAADGSGWMPDFANDREVLEIPRADQLDARLTEYAERVMSARLALRDPGADDHVSSQ